MSIVTRVCNAGPWLEHVCVHGDLCVQCGGMPEAHLCALGHVCVIRGHAWSTCVCMGICVYNAGICLECLCVHGDMCVQCSRCLQHVHVRGDTHLQWRDISGACVCMQTRLCNEGTCLEHFCLHRDTRVQCMEVLRARVYG